MKTFSKILATLTLALLCATSCVNEDPGYGKNPDVGQESEGFLALSGLSVHVIYDGNTETRPDGTYNESKSTRTGAQPNVDDFIIDIVNTKGVSQYKKTYGELKSDIASDPNNRLALPVGSYTMKVNSQTSEIADIEWEAPVYGTTYDFAIRKEETTTIGDVVCKLQNIKVTVECSADLIDRLTSDSKAVVSIGSAAADFVMGETRAAYFRAQEELNTLLFQMKGKFADTQEAAEFSKSISGVKAGQWRKITLVIAHSDEGHVDFDIVVDTFIQDEEINVDGTDGVWEPTLDEDENGGGNEGGEGGGNTGGDTAPTVVWEGYDIDATNYTVMTDDMTLNINVQAPKGIKNFVVTITSTSGPFTNALIGMGLSEPFDLANIEPGSALESTLKNDLGFPVNSDVKDKTELPFPLTVFAGILNSETFNGNHTFKLSVTDNANQTTTKTLKLTVNK